MIHCILEEHVTGLKSILELRREVGGLVWYADDMPWPGLTVQPTQARAKRQLEEHVSNTHLIKYPKNQRGFNKQIEINTVPLSLKVSPDLSWELHTLAALTKTSYADLIRNILIDYIRPGSVLPRIDKEYLQSLLAEHRATLRK